MLKDFLRNSREKCKFQEIFKFMYRLLCTCAQLRLNWWLRRRGRRRRRKGQRRQKKHHRWKVTQEKT